MGPDVLPHALRSRHAAFLDPPGALLGAPGASRDSPTSLLERPGSLLEPKNHRRMLEKPYFLQGKTKILYLPRGPTLNLTFRAT